MPPEVKSPLYRDAQLEFDLHQVVGLEVDPAV
jgi:hypothetical protein